LAPTPKKKDTLLNKIMKSTDDAKNIGLGLGKSAFSKGQKIGNNLTQDGAKRLHETLESARRAATSSKANIDLIKQLGELKEAGLITAKEFEIKKKEILDRI
jgi:hypothetical protein